MPNHIAVARPLLRRLSQATEVVSINRNIHATDFFVYAADGELITWFDLLGPYARTGSDPDRFVDMMREVGLNPDLDLDVDLEDPDLGTEFPRSFVLARKITGFPFSQDMLEVLGSTPTPHPQGPSSTPATSTARPISRIWTARTGTASGIPTVKAFSIAGELAGAEICVTKRSERVHRSVRRGGRGV
jgi:hypothetical protein